jgi:hypothetical protein
MFETFFQETHNIVHEGFLHERSFQKFSGLKHLEVLGNDGGSHPHEYGYTGILSNSMYAIIPFLHYQDGLETLVVKGLENIVPSDEPGESRSSYEGFEELLNYLPYFIAKPSFKRLRIALCKIPINSVKSMISTFLSCPTHNDQSLEIIDHHIVEKCNNTYSEAFPLMKETGNPCVNGRHKSLGIRVNTPLLSPQWLFEYPNLQLKRLELQYNSRATLDLHALDAYPSASIDTLCCKFHGLGGNAEEEANVVRKLLGLPFLSDVEFVRFHNSTAENSLMSTLANIFMQPFHLKSLRRIQLKNCFGDGGTFRTFFDAFFSMPKEQLSDFTLELIGMGQLDYCLPQSIIEAWKVNSQGQKLKKLIYLIRPNSLSTEYGGYIATPLFEPLSEIAVSVELDTSW